MNKNTQQLRQKCEYASHTIQEWANWIICFSCKRLKQWLHYISDYKSLFNKCRRLGLICMVYLIWYWEAWDLCESNVIFKYNIIC